VEFFGWPASTHKAVALLALEYKVPMQVTGVPRLGNPGRYHVIVADYLDPGGRRQDDPSQQQGKVWLRTCSILAGLLA
jgi:lauroyl/myristoyl acyltransferase